MSVFTWDIFTVMLPTRTYMSGCGASLGTIASDTKQTVSKVCLSTHKEKKSGHNFNPMHGKMWLGRKCVGVNCGIYYWSKTE